MSNKKITIGKPGGSNANMNDLLKQLGEDELLTDKGKRLPVDLHPRIHRELGELQLRITGPDGKKVTNRMLVTEALADLFAKYEAASNGENVKTNYVFNPGDTFQTAIKK